MIEKNEYDVFLSYSAKDKEWVSQFAVALKEAGVRPWFDASQVKPGERWKERIQDALRRSRTLIVILSPNSIDNPWVFFELGAAIADQKRIIPVITETLDLANLPALLKQFQGLREHSPREAAKKVAEALEEPVEI